MSEASYGAVSSAAAIWLGWTAVVKDIMILGVAIFLGLYLPTTLHGGIGPMFD